MSIYDHMVIIYVDHVALDHVEASPVNELKKWRYNQDTILI